MKSHYIANLEWWKDGQMRGWGNSAFTVSGEPDADAVFKHLVQKSAENWGCEEKHVRIIGVFKLGTSEANDA